MAKKREPDPHFEEAWKLYPRRPNNSKAQARKAWDARRKEGFTLEELLTGVREYAAYVEAEITSPRFIKQAATFFGPGLHFLNDYGIPDEGEAGMNESEKDLIQYYNDEPLV